MGSRYRFFKFTFFIFLFLVSQPLLSQPVIVIDSTTPQEDTEEAEKVLRDSKNWDYPVGSLKSFERLDGNFRGMVVLFRLSSDLLDDYQDQEIIPGYIKALAVRVNSDFDNEGRAINFSPMRSQEIENRLKNPFAIKRTDPRISLIKNKDGYLLKAKIYVHFVENDLDEESLFYRIEKGIEETWQGQVEGVSFSTDVEVKKFHFPYKTNLRLGDDFVFYPDYFDVYLSKRNERSLVAKMADAPPVGFWETGNTPKNSLEKIYAHEFGHFIGFRDLFSYIAYYDFSEKLVSIGYYTTLSFYSSLELPYLAPVANSYKWLSVNDLSANENIMANSSQSGKVLTEHLQAIIKAYKGDGAEGNGGR